MVIIILNFVLLRWMDHRRPDLPVEEGEPGSGGQEHAPASFHAREIRGRFLQQRH